MNLFLLQSKSLYYIISLLRSSDLYLMYFEKNSSLTLEDT
jgi:hypothetical protein